MSESTDFERDKNGFIILKRKYSELYKKTNYIVKDPVVQNRIYEYDIRSANVSMLREYGHIQSKILDNLEKMSKEEREITVGNMIRQNKDIYKIISTGIRKSREKLFRENLIQSSEVLSIKNDAVFIIGRKLKFTKFGSIEFRIKNQYVMFQQFDKLEFYYDRRHRYVDIKGVADSIVEHPDHQNGMMKFFTDVFQYASADQIQELREFLIQFVHDYKNRNLPHEFYREMNGNNFYRTNMEIAGFEYNMNEAGDSERDIINPIYNYRRYILPMIQYYM